MKRRLFNLAGKGATALSLLLCIAACVLWVRSYRVVDAWVWMRTWQPIANSRYPEPAARAVVSMRGSLWHGFEGSSYSVVIYPQQPGYSRFDLQKNFGIPFHPQYVNPMHSGWGFAFAAPRSMDGLVWQLLVALPYWFCMLMTMVLPLTMAIRAARRRRRAEGNVCQTCGYDLRATPERCPECGATPQPAKEAVA